MVVSNLKFTKRKKTKLHSPSQFEVGIFRPPPAEYADDNFLLFFLIDPYTYCLCT